MQVPFLISHWQRILALHWLKGTDRRAGLRTDCQQLFGPYQSALRNEKTSKRLLFMKNIQSRYPAKLFDFVLDRFCSQVVRQGRFNHTVSSNLDGHNVRIVGVLRIYISQVYTTAAKHFQTKLLCCTYYTKDFVIVHSFLCYQNLSVQYIKLGNVV